MLFDKETRDLIWRVSPVVTLPRLEQSAGGICTFQYNLVIERSDRGYRSTITQLDMQESGAKSMPIETYCQKNEVDLRIIYAALDGQIKDRLALLQESVKNYKPF